MDRVCPGSEPSSSGLSACWGPRTVASVRPAPETHALRHAMHCWVHGIPVAVMMLVFPGARAAGAPAAAWVDGAGFRHTEARPPSDGRPGFTRMDPAATGVGFTNELRGDLALTNAVAHNGAGVAVGDVDGDGRPDLYFCNLQGPNRLYRNLGDWRFAEEPPGPLACGDDLSTGAAFADVDGDGDLDLLVNGIAAGTRLFRNDGRGGWTEATDSGLSRTASATSMALADIDGDGDLDLYCTHYIDVMHLADPTTRFALATRRERHVESVTTHVVFRALFDDEIEAYVKSGEGEDKAGGYGIQGLAGAFVSRIEGSYGAVVGLPLAEVSLALRRFS